MGTDRPDIVNNPTTSTSDQAALRATGKMSDEGNDHIVPTLSQRAQNNRTAHPSTDTLPDVTQSSGGDIIIDKSAAGTNLNTDAHGSDRLLALGPMVDPPPLRLNLDNLNRADIKVGDDQITQRWQDMLAQGAGWTDESAGTYLQNISYVLQQRENKLNEFLKDKDNVDWLQDHNIDPMLLKKFSEDFFRDKPAQELLYFKLLNSAIYNAMLKEGRQREWVQLISPDMLSMLERVNATSEDQNALILRLNLEMKHKPPHPSRQENLSATALAKAREDARAEFIRHGRTAFREDAARLAAKRLPLKEMDRRKNDDLQKMAEQIFNYSKNFFWPDVPSKPDNKSPDLLANVTPHERESLIKQKEAFKALVDENKRNPGFFNSSTMLTDYKVACNLLKPRIRPDGTLKTELELAQELAEKARAVAPALARSQEETDDEEEQPETPDPLLTTIASYWKDKVKDLPVPIPWLVGTAAPTVLKYYGLSLLGRSAYSLGFWASPKQRESLILGWGLERAVASLPRRAEEAVRRQLSGEVPKPKGDWPTLPLDPVAAKNDYNREFLKDLDHRLLADPSPATRNLHWALHNGNTIADFRLVKTWIDNDDNLANHFRVNREDQTFQKTKNGVPLVKSGIPDTETVPDPRDPVVDLSKTPGGSIVKEARVVFDEIDNSGTVPTAVDVTTGAPRPMTPWEKLCDLGRPNIHGSLPLRPSSTAADPAQFHKDAFVNFTNDLETILNGRTTTRKERKTAEAYKTGHDAMSCYLVLEALHDDRNLDFLRDNSGQVDFTRPGGPDLLLARRVLFNIAHNDGTMPNNPGTGNKMAVKELCQALAVADKRGVLPYALLKKIEPEPKPKEVDPAKPDCLLPEPLTPDPLLAEKQAYTDNFLKPMKNRFARDASLHYLRDALLSNTYADFCAIEANLIHDDNFADICKLSGKPTILPRQDDQGNDIYDENGNLVYYAKPDPQKPFVDLNRPEIVGRELMQEARRVFTHIANTGNIPKKMVAGTPVEMTCLDVLEGLSVQNMQGRIPDFTVLDANGCPFDPNGYDKNIFGTRLIDYLKTNLPTLDKVVANAFEHGTDIEAYQRIYAELNNEKNLDFLRNIDGGLDYNETPDGYKRTGAHILHLAREMFLQYGWKGAKIPDDPATGKPMTPEKRLRQLIEYNSLGTLPDPPLGKHKHPARDYTIERPSRKANPSIILPLVLATNPGEARPNNDLAHDNRPEGRAAVVRQLSSDDRLTDTPYRIPHHLTGNRGLSAPETPLIARASDMAGNISADSHPLVLPPQPRSVGTDQLPNTSRATTNASSTAPEIARRSAETSEERSRSTGEQQGAGRTSRSSSSAGAANQAGGSRVIEPRRGVPVGLERNPGRIMDMAKSPFAVGGVFLASGIGIEMAFRKASETAKSNNKIEPRAQRGRAKSNSASGSGSTTSSNSGK